MGFPNGGWLVFKLSGDIGVGDIIRWYGEDTYCKLNLFDVYESSLKSVGSVYP